MTTQNTSKNTTGIISGTFCYPKIHEPSNKYQSEEKEFSIDIIVSKADFKAFGKQFPKQKGKTVETSDFKDIYKIDPPFADEDEQYVIKLKRPAQYKDGEAIPKAYWPKVLMKSANGKAAPLQEGTIVANGSTGQVSYDIKSNDFGTFAKLKNVLVETLVEYKKAGGDAANDFGLESEEVAPEFESIKDKPKEEKKPEPKVRTFPHDPDLDDDIPF